MGFLGLKLMLICLVFAISTGVSSSEEAKTGLKCVICNTARSDLKTCERESNETLVLPCNNLKEYQTAAKKLGVEEDKTINKTAVIHTTYLDFVGTDKAEFEFGCRKSSIFITTGKGFKGYKSRHISSCGFHLKSQANKEEQKEERDQKCLSKTASAGTKLVYCFCRDRYACNGTGRLYAGVSLKFLIALLSLSFL